MMEYNCIQAYSYDVVWIGLLYVVDRLNPFLGIQIKLKVVKLRYYLHLIKNKP